jgi:23S rRNA (pseudouridine1915-N3)-methyltransferase
MKIRVLIVGKPANPDYGRLAEDYLKRIRRRLAIDLEAVRPEKIERLSVNEIRDREAGQLLARLDVRDFCLALDRSGTVFNSEQFAARMNHWLQSGRRSLTFVIGGPVGLGDAVLQRADEKMALSSFTLAHELALVVLLEQLYRAFSILHGEKYHK